MGSAAFDSPRPSKRRRLLLALFGLIAIAVVAATASLIALSRVPASAASKDAALRNSPAPYAGTALGWPAPDFELTDHNGTGVRLSAFRGRVVVLAFLDSRCDETCPLTAFELRLASLAVNDSADPVVFLGVNVNRDFNSVADVDEFTGTYLLQEIPTWRFLTGDFEKLSRVWSAYSVEVIDQPHEEDYEHTPGVFIIDQDGVLRWYVSTPLLAGIGAEQWDGSRLHEILVARIRKLGMQRE